MKNKRMRYACAPPDLIRRLRISVSVAAILLLLNIGSAQNLIINGTVNNTGKIRVKSQTIIAQPAFGGELELTGANQTLPAKQYQNVRLSGTGTKTTSGGDFSVQKNLTLSASVTLQIPKGNVITLGDTLFESGILKGAIQKSVNLTGSTTSSNFGNIGAAISWSSNAPGITKIIRASDSVQIGNGNQSVKRYYQIQPTDATATGTVVLKFDDSELNGHNISNLQLWQSTDNGTNWLRHIPVVDTLLKTITKSNVTLSGRWTMADTVRALGPLQGGAGIPAVMTNNSLANIKPMILSALNPYKVVITDIFGTPISNVAVKFAITSQPSLTVSGILTDTSVITNASGVASTIMTLGNKVGTYKVTATSGALVPVVFTDSAGHGFAQSLAAALSVQTKPILTPLDTAFTVTVSDIGGNPVDSAQVQFLLVDIPSGSFGEGVSVTSSITDQTGRASTILTMGSKIAPYKVRAHVVGVSDSITFTAQATVGNPASVVRSSGDGQSGVNGTPLTGPFVISVLDLGGNPVPGDTVEFTIQSPAFGAVLSKTKVPTDNLGQASTILTLGTRTGKYSVSAQSRSLVGALQFDATANAGAASLLAQMQGNNQSSTIGSTLASDFVVRVLDANGNNVPGSTVTFSIDTIPNLSSTGQMLSVTSVVTDTSGLAATRLTFGNKAGDYFVSARVNGVPIVSFKANAQPGAAVSFAQISGSNQSTPIVTPLANEFIVRIIDIGGNNVRGTLVSFTIDSIPVNATGYQLRDTSALSDSNGLARTLFTVGNKVGEYLVKAHASGIPDTVFTAKATHGAAAAFANVSGSQQINPTGTMLDTAFTLTVKDIGGNTVPQAQVTFAITGVPAKATGQMLRDTLVTADSLGNASTYLTLGNREGLYTVVASVAGTLSTTFTTNGYYVYGDPNNDINVNIADITTIIDQIIGNQVFTEVDSIKADLNKDGNIDTSDVNTLVGTILDRPLTFATLPPFIPDNLTLDKSNGNPVAHVSNVSFAGAKTQFEVTPQGLRLNMENNVPVRGLEVRIRLKDTTVNVTGVNYLFSRAEQMNVVVRTSNNEIRLLAYSLLNSEIQAGNGTLLRIPKITSIDQIDTTQVILSIASNIAVIPEAIVVAATPGKYPLTYKLEQNYPNPFNGSTTIQYEIPDARTTEAKIAIQIFNVLGQKVKTLVAAPHDPGQYKVTWNGTDESGVQVATGIYFYRLISKSHLTTKKMIYVK